MALAIAMSVAMSVAVSMSVSVAMTVAMTMSKVSQDRSDEDEASANDQKRLKTWVSLTSRGMTNTNTYLGHDQSQ